MNEQDFEYSGDISMNSLVGRTITALWIERDGFTIIFETSEGNVTYVTEEECCSETWFSDITGVENLLGALVVATGDVDLQDYNTDDGRCRHVSDRVYGIKIKTTKGYADIVFRNSSNGYYGGSICRVSSVSPSSDFEKIVKDWTE